jgi:hypothetical protein
MEALGPAERLGAPHLAGVSQAFAPSHGEAPLCSWCAWRRQWVAATAARWAGERGPSATPPFLAGGADTAALPWEARSELGEARWERLRGLGWVLRADAADPAGRNALRRLQAFAAEADPALLRWMAGLAAALAAAHPPLAQKNAGLRLQIVALGREWYRAVWGDPSLAAFLEGEVLPVDLPAALGLEL